MGWSSGNNNQNGTVIQSLKLSKKGSIERSSKPLKNGAWAVCFLNKANHPKNGLQSGRMNFDVI
jgi:hypothetical protein